MFGLDFTSVFVLICLFSQVTEVVATQDTGRPFLCWWNTTHVGVDMASRDRGIVVLFRVSCRRKPLLGIWLRGAELVADMPVLHAPCWPSRVTMRCYVYSVNARSRELLEYAPSSAVTRLVDENVTQSSGRPERTMNLLEEKARFNEDYVAHGERSETLGSVISRRVADRARKQLKLLRRIAYARFNGEAVKVVLGSGSTADHTNMPGWMFTDKYLLDLTRPSDFDAVFAENVVDAFVAEHVLEHLELGQIQLALRTLRSFIGRNGNIRIAVPDIFSIRVNNLAAISKDFFDGHYVQLSHEYLRMLLDAAGFSPKLLEYEHQRHLFWVSGAELGRVERSSFHDRRGAVSIIVDATPRAVSDPTSENSKVIERLVNMLDACFRREHACSEGSKHSLTVATLNSAWEADVQDFRIVLGTLLSYSLKAVESWIQSMFSLGDDKYCLQELRDELVTMTNLSPKVDTCLLDIAKYTSELIALQSPRLRNHIGTKQNSSMKCQEEPAVPEHACRVCLDPSCQRVSQSAIDCFSPRLCSLQALSNFTLRPNQTSLPKQMDTNSINSSGNQVFQHGVSAQAQSRTKLSQMPESGPNLVFVTLVLNGLPFIRYHINQFNTLGSELRWQWHIVEGVAFGRAHHLYPYSTKPIPASFYTRKGRSVDGTSGYIDALALRFPGKVVIHRRHAWRDKVEMLNAVLTHISSPVVLMQIDVDELWTANQITKAFYLLHRNRTACAYFHCHFHITPELLTYSTNVYSHRNDIEWLRMWSYRPGMLWIAHAPPKLVSKEDTRWTILEGERCIQHNETESLGLVFTHHAYSLESQVAFKEAFYGYKGALAQWRALRKSTNERSVDVNVSAFLSWVGPGTVRAVGKLTPVIGSRIPVIPRPSGLAARHLVVDAVVFQVQPRGGIARVWRSLLPILLSHMRNLGWDVTIILRGTDRIPFESISNGFVGKVTLAPYLHGGAKTEESKTLAELKEDEEMLSTLMKRLEATVFLSTLYTTALSVPNVLLVHDMIPEEFQWDLTRVEWRTKQRAIGVANEIVTVSQETLFALERYYTVSKDHTDNVTLSYDRTVFYPRPNKTSGAFLLLVGPRRGYKGGAMFFKAIAAYPTLLTTRAVTFVGDQPLTPEEARVLHRAGIAFKHYGFLPDEDLATIYSSASALVYLSVREGFGLPVLEAMACGCPVVLLQTNKASMEVATSRVAFMVDPQRDSKALIKTINQATTPSQLRQRKVQEGVTRAKRWPTWDDTAMSILDILSRAENS